jgi:hypothetical protein
MMMANSRENAPLTEKQEEEMLELRKKEYDGKLTFKQGARLTELAIKKEKSSQVVLGDTAVAFLLECYAWETQGMVSVTKEIEIEAFDRGRQTEP